MTQLVPGGGASVVGAPPRPLGVGCSYLPSLPTVTTSVLDLVDFVEVSPDLLCREVVRTAGSGVGMAFVPRLLDDALSVLDGVPVTVHGLELSIGTAGGWNEAYLEVLDQFLDLVPARWHSEHLGFLLAQRTDGRTVNTGVPLPLPFTREAVECVAPRAAALVDRYRLPFLLENAAHYLPGLPADPGWDEIDFLCALTEAAPCGLLLDLFNLHCNAVNHGFDLMAALARLPLDRVVEVHLAGGGVEHGFLLDSHSGSVPPPVWTALEWLLPRAPNLAGVLYEVQEPAFPLVGLGTFRGELDRAGQLWRRHHGGPG